MLHNHIIVSPPITPTNLPLLPHQGFLPHVLSKYIRTFVSTTPTSIRVAVGSALHSNNPDIAYIPPRQLRLNDYIWSEISNGGVKKNRSQGLRHCFFRFYGFN